jgi:hypothetical protein
VRRTWTGTGDGAVSERSARAWQRTRWLGGLDSTVLRTSQGWVGAAPGARSRVLGTIRCGCRVFRPRPTEADRASGSCGRVLHMISCFTDNAGQVEISWLGPQRKQGQEHADLAQDGAPISKKEDAAADDDFDFEASYRGRRQSVSPTRVGPSSCLVKCTLIIRLKSARAANFFLFFFHPLDNSGPTMPQLVLAIHRPVEARGTMPAMARRSPLLTRSLGRALIEGEQLGRGPARPISCGVLRSSQTAASSADLEILGSSPPSTTPHGPYISYMSRCVGPTVDTRRLVCGRVHLPCPGCVSFAVN